MHVKGAVVASVAFLLAGCTGSVAGNASPSPGVPASPSPTGQGANVPKVSHPLEIARYEKDPCAALTSDQLATLGIATQPKPDLEDRLGPGCQWNAYDEIGITVGATLLTVGSSLIDLYKQHEQGAWPYFEPVSDVAGYPGVLMDGIRAAPKSTCDLSVAVRDDLIYSIQLRIDPQKEEANDPCPVVRKIGEMAVSTMKAGA